MPARSATSALLGVYEPSSNNSIRASITASRFCCRRSRRPSTSCVDLVTRPDSKLLTEALSLLSFMPMKADAIPVGHTPPGGYGADMPPPILAGCDEPLVAGAPDLRGMWRVVWFEWAGGSEPHP